MSQPRFVLVVSHIGNPDALSAAKKAMSHLLDAGITPVMTEANLADFKAATEITETVKVLGTDCQLADLELAMVLGGDGTILKAAEIVRDGSVPLMGINLGHVGFLAESEKDEFAQAVQRIVARDYTIEDRLTLDVTVLVGGKKVFETWALNEAAVEKSASERMLEVLLEVEAHPLSSFGCDGILVSTPTGSTAYGFSAGGPVIWPTVDALLVVPLSAHALFARPLVLDPKAKVAIDVLERSAGQGVLWCDGRRTTELPAGARVEVSKSAKPVRLARLHTGSFTDRLVKKFSLPVTGWRGN